MMQNYRYLCSFLRREYAEYSVSFRRRDLGCLYGRCDLVDLVDRTFLIEINRSLCEGGAILCLLHEMAHVLSWFEDEAPSDHGPAFGRAYHLVWEAYLRYLGS